MGASLLALAKSIYYVDLAKAKGEAPVNEKTLHRRNPKRIEPAIS